MSRSADIERPPAVTPGRARECGATRSRWTPRSPRGRRRSASAREARRRRPAPGPPTRAPGARFGAPSITHNTWCGPAVGRLPVGVAQGPEERQHQVPGAARGGRVDGVRELERAGAPAVDLRLRDVARGEAFEMSRSALTQRRPRRGPPPGSPATLHGSGNTAIDGERAEPAVRPRTPRRCPRGWPRGRSRPGTSNENGSANASADVVAAGGEGPPRRPTGTGGLPLGTEPPWPPGDGAAVAAGVGAGVAAGVAVSGSGPGSPRGRRTVGAWQPAAAWDLAGGGGDDESRDDGCGRACTRRATSAAATRAGALRSGVGMGTAAWAAGRGISAGRSSRSGPRARCARRPASRRPGRSAGGRRRRRPRSPGAGPAIRGGPLGVALVGEQREHQVPRASSGGGVDRVREDERPGWIPSDRRRRRATWP